MNMKLYISTGNGSYASAQIIIQAESIVKAREVLAKEAKDYSSDMKWSKLKLLKPRGKKNEVVEAWHYIE